MNLTFRHFLSLLLFRVCGLLSTGMMANPSRPGEIFTNLNHAMIITGGTMIPAHHRDDDFKFPGRESFNLKLVTVLSSESDSDL